MLFFVLHLTDSQHPNYIDLYVVMSQNVNNLLILLQGIVLPQLNSFKLKPISASVLIYPDFHREKKKLQNRGLRKKER